jgi:hypothetical protein
VIVELRRREYDEEVRSRTDDRALEHQNFNTHTHRERERGKRSKKNEENNSER